MEYPITGCDDDHDIMTITTTTTMTTMTMTMMMMMMMMMMTMTSILLINYNINILYIYINICFYIYMYYIYICMYVYIHLYIPSITIPDPFSHFFPSQELRVALREVAGAGAVPARGVLRRSGGSGDAQGGCGSMSSMSREVSRKLWVV